MFKKILIFGGSGQLGTSYKNYFETKGVGVETPVLDVRDEVAVRGVLQLSKPDVVINLAAVTDIDWCEKNKLEAFSVNTLGAGIVAKVCAECRFYLLHMSSGCIQESKSAAEVWSEDDPPTPLCFYSWTKVWAENLVLDCVRKYNLQALILRPRQLLSAIASPRNALTKMLTYTKFIDTANSCTVIEDLMWATAELLKRNAFGVFNVTNPGVITPYEIALMLRDIIKPEMEVTKISKEELNRMTLAKRIDAVLSTIKLNSLGIHLPEIHERIREILLALKKNLDSEAGKTVLSETLSQTQKKLFPRTY